MRWRENDLSALPADYLDVALKAAGIDMSTLSMPPIAHQAVELAVDGVRRRAGT